jgi:hypothetical protein
MIIARIRGRHGEFLFHGSCEITGSPAAKDYREEGWFPVEGFNFGFNEKSDKTDETKPGIGGPASKTTPPGRLSGASTNQSGSKDSGEEKAFSKIEISKQVDRATGCLMMLAMKERSQKMGPKKDKEYRADIHILASVQYEENKVERNLYPSVMIHLEGVHVTKWGINASGDGRPSESVSLSYDKAAMHYMWLGENRYFQAMGISGWDQGENKSWEPDDIDEVFKKYIPTPHDIFLISDEM